MQQLSLANLPAAVLNSRRLAALAERDKSRWERAQVDPTIEEDPGKWSFPTIPFAATHVWDMPRLRVGVCARAARLLHGRHWTEYEEAKSAKTREEWATASKCPLCGMEADTQDHWIRRCQQPELMSIREQAFQALATTISSFAPALRRPALRIVDMAREVDGYRLCIGNWSPWHIYSRWTSHICWNANKLRTFCGRCTTHLL